jgi:hypothetical protein
MGRVMERVMGRVTPSAVVLPVAMVAATGVLVTPAAMALLQTLAVTTQVARVLALGLRQGPWNLHVRKDKACHMGQACKRCWLALLRQGRLQTRVRICTVLKHSEHVGLQYQRAPTKVHCPCTTDNISAITLLTSDIEFCG